MLTFIIPLLLGTILGFLIRGKPSETVKITNGKRSTNKILFGAVSFLFFANDAFANRYSYESDYYSNSEGSGLGSGGVLIVALFVLFLFWEKIWNFLKTIGPAIVAGLALIVVILAIWLFVGEEILEWLFSNPIVLGLLAIGWLVWVWGEIKNK